MTTSDDKAARSSTGVRRWLGLLPEIAVLALCIPLWVVSAEWTSSVGGPGPAFYPRLLIVLLVVAMAVRILHDAMAIRRGVGDSEDADEAMEEGVEMDPSLIDMRRVFVVILLSVGYVVASLFLGWLLATFVLVPVFLWLTGRRNLLITVPLALVFSLGMTFVFVKIVYISLPTGVGVFDQFTVLLFELLGIY